MFVWIFHRISGVVLILLMVFQISTGVLQAGTTDAELAKTMVQLHRHATANTLLAFLFIFHGLYGVRTILMDLGVRREKFLFWLCTLVGLVLFGTFLVFFSAAVPV